MTRIAFPVDTGSPDSSYLVCVRLTRSFSHSVNGGGKSALKEHSGAFHVWNSLADDITQIYHAFEFSPLLPADKLASMTPDNLADFGDSDSGAAVLAVAQAMAHQDTEPNSDTPIVAVSCAFGPHFGQAGVLSDLTLSRVTQEDDMDDACARSLVNKWQAARRCGQTLALVLHETDAKLLGKAVGRRPLSLSAGVFQELDARRRKEPASYQPEIVACKSGDLFSLAKALGANASLFDKKKNWALRAMTGLWFVTALLLFLWWWHTLPAVPRTPSMSLQQQPKLQMFPCLADAFRGGFSFVMFYHAKRREYEFELSKALGNLSIILLDDKEKNQESIRQRYGDKAQSAFEMGYAVADCYLAAHGQIDSALTVVRKHAHEVELPEQAIQRVLTALPAQDAKTMEAECNYIISCLNDIDLKNNGISIVDIDLTKFAIEGLTAKYPHRTVQMGDVFYVCGLSGPFYTPFHPFLSKFDKHGEQLWTYVSPANSANTGLSCAIDKDGQSVYLVYTWVKDDINRLRIEKISAQGELLWQGPQETVPVSRLLPESCAADAQNGVWIVGAKHVGSSERMMVLHYSAEGNKMSEQQWGETRCGAGAIISESAQTLLIAGYFDNYPSDLLVLRRLADGQLTTIYHPAVKSATDVKPFAMLKMGNKLYISAIRASPRRYYFPVVYALEFRPDGNLRLSREIVLPRETFFTSWDEHDVLNWEYHFPLVAWQSHVVVGYHDSLGVRDRALTIVDAKTDEVVWSLINGWPNYHEMLTGFYINTQERYIITVESNNRFRGNAPKLGLIQWAIQTAGQTKR